MAVAFASSLSAAAAADKAAALVWPIPDWQVSTPGSEGLSATKLDRLGEWLERHGSRTGLVIRHGRIVGEWYFDGAKPTTQLLVYSVTKSVSSTAVGMAIDKHKLSLDVPLGKFLPELAPQEKQQITVGQLLSMTTGLHNEKKLDRFPDQFRYSMLEAPLDFRPGEKWDYNNTGLALLSPLFQAAMGQPLDQFVGAKLFKPIGIRPTDWSWDHNADVPLPFSGLHITARGLARFGLLVLRGGRWKDKQIVSADWLARAVQPSQGLEKSYGYLWWNNTQGKWRGVPADAFGAIGKFENDLLIIPSLDLIVIRQVGDPKDFGQKFKIDELFRLAADAVEDAPATK